MMERVVLIVLATCIACAALSEDEDTFNQWMDGIQSTHLDRLPARVKSTDNWGRGIYATFDVSAGDILQAVPLNYVVCLQTVNESPHREVFNLAEANTDKLALFLLAEKHNPSSRFAAWFPLMPTKFESPPFFEDSELALLKGDSIYQDALDAKAGFRSGYDALKDRVFKESPNIFPEGCCDFAEYCWARHMIESRAWHLRGRQYLVPMADFFNHKPHPTQQYEDYVPDVRGEFFEKHHKVTATHVQVIADRDTKAGGQIFETYGDNSNHIYLMYHGFVPENNPFECVQIALPHLFETGISEQLRRDLIEAVQGIGLQSSNICVRNEQGMFDKAIAYMRVKAMTSSDVSKCRDAQTASGEWSTDLLAACTSSSVKTLAPLLQIVGRMLRGYPSTTLEDESILTTDISTRERWARMYVLTRKRILRGFEIRIDAAMKENPAPHTTDPTGEAGSGQHGREEL